MLNYSIYDDNTNQANQFFEIDSNGVVRTKAGVDLKTTGQTEFDVSHFLYTIKPTCSCNKDKGTIGFAWRGFV